jgi:DNA-binding MarR family transcriptional regulator
MATASKRHGLAIAEFCLAVQRFLRASERFAGEAGLNPLDYDLLLALSAYPRGTCSSIALLSERLLSQHHVAAGAVTRLSEKELVSTERNERDRRSVILTLTAKGKLLLKDIALRSLGELNAQGPRMIDSLSTLMHDENGAALVRSRSEHPIPEYASER